MNGQERRAWLDRQGQNALDALSYYLGPGVPVNALAQLGDMFNPVADIGRAGTAMRGVVRPGASVSERVNALGNVATDMASVLAPVGGAAYADDAARGLSEALANWSMPADDAVGRLIADEYGGVGLNSRTMYHGSPDVRGLRESGGFEPRTKRVRRVKDPKRYAEIQAALGDITPGTSAYERALNDLADATEYAEVPSPVFLTTDRRVAESYADDSRAFDYQNAEPRVLSVQSSPERVLDIDAQGENFRGIAKDQVRAALRASGVPENEIEAAVNRYIYGRASDRMSTDDLSALANDFGFQAVDVNRVKDNYYGSGPNTTVRMVLGPSLISILNKYGLAGMMAGGAYSMAPEEQY